MLLLLLLPPPAPPLLPQVELRPGNSDEQYLSELHAALQTAAAKFPRPHLIIYNAGELLQPVTQS
jgi:hypothetical protein